MQLSGADAAVSRMLIATEGLRRAESALLAERRLRDSAGSLLSRGAEEVGCLQLEVNTLQLALAEADSARHEAAEQPRVHPARRLRPHVLLVREIRVERRHRRRVRPPMGAPTCDTNSRPAGQPGRGGPQLLLQGPPVQLFIEQPTAIPRRGSPNTERPGSTGGRGTEEPLIRTRSLALPPAAHRACRHCKRMMHG